MLPILWKTFRLRAVIAALVLILIVGSGRILRADADGEYEVKAAFLYKFVNFVEWPPESKDQVLCIGIIGEDPFGGALDLAVKGKPINGREFSIQRFKPGREVTGCQIVFISASEKKRVRSILDQLEGISILTVSEVPGFCEAGGMVNFELLNERVRFEINPEAAERVRLKLSSKLLNVAKVVREAKPQ